MKKNTLLFLLMVLAFYPRSQSTTSGYIYKTGPLITRKKILKIRNKYLCLLTLLLFNCSQEIQGIYVDSSIEALPIPVLRYTEYDGDYEPTCLSNGFIGLRPGLNPLEPSRTTVAGFTRYLPLLGNESLCPAPYPLAAEIKLDGQNAKMETIEQSLDLSYGELTTTLRATTNSGKKAEIKIVQFASRSVPSVVAEEIHVTPSQDTEVEITSYVAMNNAPVEIYQHHPYYQEYMWDHFLGLKSDKTKLGIAVIVNGDSLEKVKSGAYKAKIEAGASQRFEVFASMISEYYSVDADQQAGRMSQWALMIGYDDLKQQNRDKWSELWKSRIKVKGDEEAQRALDVAFYYLHSEAHSSSQLSIPAFGLTRPDNYFGHIFWDADAWMFLPIVLTDPDAGRQMMQFRKRGLESAMKIASIYGYQGAQYPWETAQSEGDEDNPVASHTGWSEHYVGHHVAISQWQYCLATGDRIYMKESAWPVLREIANWISTRGIWTDRGYEIHDLVGVDELTPNISNGSHMNLTAIMALEAAIACGEELGEQIPEKWRITAKNVFIPFDPTGTIIIPYPEAKHQPGKLGYSVGMLQYLMVHEPPVPYEIYKTTWEYEEKVRKEQPDGPGNPASAGANGFGSIPMSAAAAFFGNRNLAQEIFHSSWKPYWRGPYGMMAEYRHNNFGGFITTYGSFLQSTLLGFTGLRVVEGDWQVYPVSLPSSWERIECDRIWVKGKPMRLVAEHGKKALLLPLEMINEKFL